VSGAGAAAVHVLAWPYTAVILALTVICRLLAERARARRKTLVDLVSHAPTGTIVIMERGPGGPAADDRLEAIEFAFQSDSAPRSLEPTRQLRRERFGYLQNNGPP
jgi:hypothetical protein